MTNPFCKRSLFSNRSDGAAFLTTLRKNTAMAEIIGARSRSMAGRFGVESPLVHSKNFPRYPWNIPQTPNQQFMKEILSFGAGYVGVLLDSHNKNVLFFHCMDPYWGGGKNSMFFAAPTVVFMSGVPVFEAF